MSGTNKIEVPTGVGVNGTDVGWSGAVGTEFVSEEEAVGSIGHVQTGVGVSGTKVGGIRLL